MERSYKTREHISCGYCGGVFREKNFTDHLHRRHEGKERKYAYSENHAVQLRLMWAEIERKKREEQAQTAIQREKTKLLERKAEQQKALAEEKERILEKRKRKEEQDAAEKRKKLERKRKRSVSYKKNKKEAANQSNPPPNASSATADHDYYQRPCVNVDSPVQAAVRSTQGFHSTVSEESRATAIEAQGMSPGRRSPQKYSNLKEKSASDFSQHTTICSSLTLEQNSMLERGGTGTANSSHRCEDVAPIPNEAAVREQYRLTKSLEDLSNCSPDIFKYDELKGSFQCIPCTRFYDRPNSILYSVKPLDPDSIQKEKFRSLKKKLLSHMYSSSQHKAAIIPKANASSNDDCETDEYRAGMAVGRAAYGCVKKGSSYRDFETDLCMRSADNFDVGNINHSASFASALTKHFHNELHDRIQAKLMKPLPGTGEPAPFAVVCDKMTPSRTTLHNIGLIAPVDKGRLRATFLEAKPSGDGSGFGMAREIHSAIRRVYSADDIRTRFAGAAVDGAYINCNIKEHLLDTLGVNDEAKDSYAVSWDPAHQLELAGKTSRKQDGSKIGVPWIKETVNTINHFSSKFGRGKGWKELQEAHILAQTLDDDKVEKKAPRLQNFSATRFSSYAYRAISAVRKNWSNIYNNASVTKADKSLLTDPKFILRMCGMEDSYSAISKASIYLQSSRIYPWNAVECVETCSESLTQMASVLRSSDNADLPHTLFPTLSVAATEISSAGSYQGTPLIDSVTESSNGQPSYSTDISQTREEVAKHIEEFVAEVGKRQRETLERVTKVSREVFALKKIVTREHQEVPPELRQLFLLHKMAGFITTTENYDTIESQYKLFLKEVHNQNKLEFSSTNDYISKEEKIYASLLSSKEPSSSFQGVSKMLATSITQTHCEAVTEGWGSVLDARVKSKINLDPEKLSQEVFIKLNGPPPSIKCNKVVAGALDRHFGGRNKWHFYRSSRHIQDKSTSVVLNRLKNADEGFPLD